MTQILDVSSYALLLISSITRKTISDWLLEKSIPTQTQELLSELLERVISIENKIDSLDHLNGFIEHVFATSI